MKIGIDARPLVSEKPSGISVYMLEILRAMKLDDGNEYILYSNAPLKNPDPIVKKFKHVIVPGKTGTLVICFGLKKQLEKDKIDVFWGTEHMLPLNTKSIRKVLTVHDLALMIHPQWGEWKNVIMQNIFCRMSCKKADKIITVSEATKRDVIQLLAIEEERVTAVLSGCGTAVMNDVLEETEKAKIEERLGLKERPFFAYVGTIEPRKNIIGIVEAFSKFRKKNNEEYVLVLAGRLGWKTGKILNTIQESEYAEDIILAGYISNNEKIYLLKNAVALLFPSHYEGFGLPILEAMSYGIPVISARNSSLTEVGGEEVFYADSSNNTDMIADFMKITYEMTEEERLIKSRVSKEWVSRFNWREAAIKTQKQLEEWI